MNTLPKILQSTTKIRFQDCDPFNHLNNGSYINYFMNHREDVLIKYYDLDIYKIAQKKGKSWVSSSNQIAYLKPALLSENVIIESKLIAFNDSELKVEMCMYDSNKNHLKSIIWCSFVHYNLLTQKREFHSEPFLNLFNQVCVPTTISNFEERLLTIKNELQNINK